MVASVLCAALARGDEPPANLARRIADRETETQKVQSNYTYQQTVTVEDFDPRGMKAGEYREVRDIIFSPTHERTEQLVGKASNTLARIKMTDEDFRDLREVQPFLLTREMAFIYETRFRGEEIMDGIDCWVLLLRPRQILQGQRLFDGMIWVDKKDFSIIRSEGEAVPQIRTTKDENLFPRFTTVRAKMEGGYWFPSVTSGDDKLQFKTGPQRIRLSIRYSNYRRFGADTNITFEK
jgi:hypothetical protein